MINPGTSIMTQRILCIYLYMVDLFSFLLSFSTVSFYFSLSIHLYPEYVSFMQCSSTWIFFCGSPRLYLSYAPHAVNRYEVQTFNIWQKLLEWNWLWKLVTSRILAIHYLLHSIVFLFLSWFIGSFLFFFQGTKIICLWFYLDIIWYQGYFLFNYLQTILHQTLVYHLCILVQRYLQVKFLALA